MAVPKGKRDVSKIAYFDEYYKLAENLLKFLISSFGVNQYSKDPRVFMNNVKMSEEDREAFTKIIEEYHIGIETGPQEWLLDAYRKYIMDDVHIILDKMSIASSIYPNSMDEYNFKRRLQNEIVGHLNAIKHHIQLAINIFPVNLKKLVQYVRPIDEEIERIKIWRKDGNKLKKNCADNDERSLLYALRRLADNNQIVIDENNVIHIEDKPKENKVETEIKRLDNSNSDKPKNTMLERIYKVSRSQAEIAYSNYISNNYTITNTDAGISVSNNILGVVFVDDYGNIDAETTIKIHTT